MFVLLFCWQFLSRCPSGQKGGSHLQPQLLMHKGQRQEPPRYRSALFQPPQRLLFLSHFPSSLRTSQSAAIAIPREKPSLRKDKVNHLLVLSRRLNARTQKKKKTTTKNPKPNKPKQLLASFGLVHVKKNRSRGKRQP